MKDIAGYVGIASAAIALGSICLFGANLFEVVMLAPDPAIGVTRYPNLDWTPLFGAAVFAVVAYYASRKTLDRTVLCLRWLLVIPIVFAAWWAVLAVFFRLALALDRLCRPADVLSGMCMAWWFHPSMIALMTVGGAVSAWAVVFSAYRVAPAYKEEVSLLVFVIGALIAATAVYSMDETALPPLAAIAAGALTFSVMNGRLSFARPDLPRRSPESTS